MSTEPDLTQPGIWHNIPNDTYHNNTNTLSASELQLLDDAPIRYHHRKTNPPETKPHFDFGHAAHQLVLGAGDPIKRIDADNWRTKAAKQAATEAREQGQTPLLGKDADRVEAMAKAIKNHPIAPRLLTNGTPETVITWTDPPTQTPQRAKYDWLPEPGPRRMIIPDYKTAASVEPAALERAAHQHRYHQQAAQYIDGAVHAGLDPNPGFVFIFQEKLEPYVVAVYEPDHLAIELGRRRNHLARLTWAECRESGNWPAYSDDIELLSLPPWAAREVESE